MRQTILTRNDAEGLSDGIAWAFEVHIKEPDDLRIIVMVLYGNEDSPDRIEGFAENHYRADPVMVWCPPEPEEELRQTIKNLRADLKALRVKYETAP